MAAAATCSAADALGRRRGTPAPGCVPLAGCGRPLLAWLRHWTICRLMATCGEPATCSSLRMLATLHLGLGSSHDEKSRPEASTGAYVTISVKRSGQKRNGRE